MVGCLCSIVGMNVMRKKGEHCAWESFGYSNLISSFSMLKNHISSFPLKLDLFAPIKLKIKINKQHKKCSITKIESKKK
jgi:hypothetical protein